MCCFVLSRVVWCCVVVSCRVVLRRVVMLAGHAMSSLRVVLFCVGLHVSCVLCIVGPKCCVMFCAIWFLFLVLCCVARVCCRCVVLARDVCVAWSCAVLCRAVLCCSVLCCVMRGALRPVDTRPKWWAKPKLQAVFMLKFTFRFMSSLVVCSWWCDVWCCVVWCGVVWRRLCRVALCCVVLHVGAACHVKLARFIASRRASRVLCLVYCRCDVLCSILCCVVSVFGTVLCGMRVVFVVLCWHVMCVCVLRGLALRCAVLCCVCLCCAGP